MNAVFFMILTLSLGMLAVTSPSAVLESMLNGGQKAIELSVTMLSIYLVWMGLLKIAERCGVISGLSRLLKRPIRWLFGSCTEKANESLAVNVAANLIGMGGVATPMGIEAARELDRQNNAYAMNMLFILSATSIQLLPTSVIALREQAGSTAAGDIILPTLVVTLLSSALAVAAAKIIYRSKKL